MPKFVIQYTWDGGYNAESNLAVHCVEYESLEKLKEDFRAFVLKQGESQYKPLAPDRNMFLNQMFQVRDMYAYKYEDNRQVYYIPDGQMPDILPLDEWFETRKKEEEQWPKNL